MQYTQLGRTGLKVSRLCLGTMNFGPQTEERDAHAIMDKAHELELNFFDTANGYGGRQTKGRTEEIIGRWFAQGGGRRDKTVLATKVYASMTEWPNHSKLSAVNIKRACDESLRRLQTDYIDLYQMHHVDRATPWEEIWQAMEQLIQQGKVLYVGSSNFAGWHIATANGVAAGRNTLGLVSEQSKYNLLTRTVELEVLPACQYHGLGVIPYSPLGGGLLGGILKKIEGGRRANEGVQRLLDKHRPQVEKWEAFCEELGQSPSHVALAWLLANPAVTAPIIGPRTLDQFVEACGALDVTLDEQAMAKLDEIWPGPGGTAPEAYAW